MPILWYDVLMKIFKKYTYNWWQIGLFKLASLSFGIAIGAFLYEVFSQYIINLVMVGIVLSVYLIFVSLGQQ